MWTGERAPQDEEINNEEFVDQKWGGDGRVSVYDNNNKLIDGNLKRFPIKQNQTDLNIPDKVIDELIKYTNDPLKRINKSEDLLILAL
jgi:hypothetical protein